MKLIKYNNMPNRYFASKYDELLDIAAKLKKGERYEIESPDRKQTSIYQSLRRRVLKTKKKVRVFMRRGVTNLTPIK